MLTVEERVREDADKQIKIIENAALEPGWGGVDFREEKFQLPPIANQKAQFELREATLLMIFTGIMSYAFLQSVPL